MAEIIVTVTDTQVKCLEYAAVDIQEWSTNAIHERARRAQNEIIAELIKHCNENEITIATGVDAQITQAYSLGVVKTAKQRTDEVMPS